MPKLFFIEKYFNSIGFIELKGVSESSVPKTPFFMMSVRFEYICQLWLKMTLYDCYFSLHGSRMTWERTNESIGSFLIQSKFNLITFFWAQ